MSIAKNMLLSSNSSNEKTNQKDSDDLWRRKLTLKVKFRHFLTPPHYTNLQNSMISFDYSWFLAKKHSNFVTLPWKIHNRYCHRLKLKLNDPPKNACALQLQPLIFLWDTAYFFWPLHFLDWYPLKLEMDHVERMWHLLTLHCILWSWITRLHDCILLMLHQ